MSLVKNKKVLYAGIALIAVMLTVVAVIGGIRAAKVVAAASQWDPRSLQPDMTTFIYDKDGGLLASLHGGENRVPVSLQEIPKHVREAFIAIEDARFYEHRGVDIQAIARAALANIRSNRVVEGGSTITQQLAKNSFLSSERTLERKVKEAILAYDLEKKYTKDEILELYLNRVYFGHGVYGVQSASKLYFNKDIGDITLAEGALLAGIIKSPNSYSPYNYPEKARMRMETVLASMEACGFITKQQREAAKSAGFRLVEFRSNEVWRHPYFVDYVIDYVTKNLNISEDRVFRGGLKIYTTLDPRIQTIVEEILADDKYFPKGKPDQMVQGAMVVTDYRTGEVKALVGGRQPGARRGFNRATEMRRQPGSSFKPIAAYGPALELKYPPTLLLEDAPTTFSGGYTPGNSNGRFMGLITMRTALKYSNNIYTVKLLDLIGVETGYNFARKLGIGLTENDKVLSMALGGLTYGVTPLEMARAFGAFANQGVLVESTPIKKIVDSQNKTIVDFVPQKTQAMEKQTAWLMTEMLRGAVNGGTGTAARMNRPVAGKTGTTQVPDTREFRGLGKAHKDAWFVGYTPELVASVWIGYDNTDREHYISVYGGNNPARIWKSVMSKVLQDTPVRNFEKPDIKFEFRKGRNAGVKIPVRREKKKNEREVPAKEEGTSGDGKPKEEKDFEDKDKDKQKDNREEDNGEKDNHDEDDREESDKPKEGIGKKGKDKEDQITDFTDPGNNHII